MPLDHIAASATYDNSPKPAADNDLSVLTSIYEDNINIAVWQREQKVLLEQYAQQWCDQYASHSPRLLLPTQTQQLNGNLAELLPDLEHKDIFQQDVALLVDMFACLFEADEVGLRLTPLAKAMCPRFHVDNIPCRLVTTYGGVGTQWLLEDNVDRRRLGRGANGLPDSESGIFKDDKQVQQLNTQYVALLKGSGWEGNEDNGLVHRSPSLLSGQARLLLTLDFA